MNTTLATLLSVFALPLLSALTYAVAAGGKALSAWLQAKASTHAVAREAMVLEDLALAVVQDIEANEKKALADKGPGPLTASDAKQLKDLALQRLKATLQARGLDTLKAMLGALTTSPQLDTVLSGKIEQAVVRVSTPTPSPK